MDNNILITWVFMVVVGLSIDILAYVLLRAQWKKSGVNLTDMFWERAWGRIDQIAQAVRERLRPFKLQPAPASSLPQPQSESEPEPASAPLPSQVPVEFIPISVTTVGGLRRVEFSMEMRMNTTMEVRIGATSEAGVTVEKREL